MKPRGKVVKMESKAQEPTKQTKDYEKVLKDDAEARDAEDKKKKEEAPKRTMEEFLDDPKEQAHARKLATDIQDIVGRNWWDTKRYMKKTKRGQHEAYLQLNLLEQFGHLAIQGQGKAQRYKVVFDTEDQQKLVQDKIAHHELQVKIFKNQMKELKQRQKLLDADVKKKKKGNK